MSVISRFLRFSPGQVDPRQHGPRHRSARPRGAGRFSATRVTAMSAGMAVVVSGTLLGAAALPATAAGSGCAKVLVVGARGMTQTGTFGSMLQPMADALVAQLPTTVAEYGLPYPASSDILGSTNSGVAMLTGYLESQIVACPNIRFVVLGYSEGALTVGETFAPATRYAGVVTTPLPADIVPHTAAVVMFGDGRFNSNGPEAVGTFWPDTDAPYARPATAFAALGDHVRDVCNAQDGICQNIPGSQSTAAAHQDYGKYTTALVGYVQGQLGL